MENLRKKNTRIPTHQIKELLDVFDGPVGTKYSERTGEEMDVYLVPGIHRNDVVFLADKAALEDPFVTMYDNYRIDQYTGMTCVVLEIGNTQFPFVEGKDDRFFRIVREKDMLTFMTYYAGNVDSDIHITRPLLPGRIAPKEFPTLIYGVGQRLSLPLADIDVVIQDVILALNDYFIKGTPDDYHNEKSAPLARAVEVVEDLLIALEEERGITLNLVHKNAEVMPVWVHPTDLADIKSVAQREQRHVTDVQKHLGRWYEKRIG
jgi:hypothetical protein